MLAGKPTATSVSHTVSFRVNTELNQHSKDSKRVKPILENQLENSGTQKEDDKKKFLMHTFFIIKNCFQRLTRIPPEVSIHPPIRF